MSISTVGSQLSNLYILQMLRQQLNQTQERISTGKKGTMLSDLGGSGATNALAYRNSQTMLETYITNLNTVKARVTVMDKAMGSMTDTVRDVLSTLRSQVQDGAPYDEITRDQAQNALQDVVSKLNVKLGDRFLFSGSDIENAPMSDQSLLNSNVSSAISALMSGTFDKDDATNALRGIAGADLGYSAGSLAAETVSFRADDGRDVDYTTMAHRAGFSDVLRGLAVISNLPTPTNEAETEKYWTLVNSAIDMLDQGARQIDNYQGALGSKANTITTLLESHQDDALTLENFIGDVEDIDTAEAATRLETLKAQLQISYNVTASLQDLSLANFI
ncbi:MAG TPA: flagellin [Alphaproteobacteria bacterium]